MATNPTPISAKDIEERLINLKEETDEINGPDEITRRLIIAGVALVVLGAVYYVGKRRGEKTKTFIEVVRSQ
ncbi:MAG: hypothetical protein CL470_03175 [Acidimicrobiaceae bacterium]|nr:hypothetical protein [Acidimicrobiaceae bacterium]|tara:strand:+ start:222 stop:437 length:216 start_codon:yes stop_codon:yes gene_type:complete